VLSEFVLGVVFSPLVLIAVAILEAALLWLVWCLLHSSTT
jgi:hypothetical protein